MNVARSFSAELGSTVTLHRLGRVSFIRTTRGFGVGLNGDRVDRCIDNGAIPHTSVTRFLTTCLQIGRS